MITGIKEFIARLETRLQDVKKGKKKGKLFFVRGRKRRPQGPAGEAGEIDARKGGAGAEVGGL